MAKYGPAALIGAGTGFATDVAIQLATNGGNFECVDWGEAAISGAVGAVSGVAFKGVSSSWHVAKKGWHIGKLGYHEIGKNVLKSNLGKDFVVYANSKSFLHLNIANRHFIFQLGKIIQQIKYWRYLK